MAKAKHKSFVTRVCLICSRKYNDSEISDPQISMRQFLRLFQRYLSNVNCDGESIDNTFPLPFTQIDDEKCRLLQGLGSCQHCYYLIEDFCKVYDQMKCAEMKLNWRVKNFHDILTSAKKVPSSTQDFLNQIPWNDNNKEASDRIIKQTFDKIASFRKKLIAKCSSKVGSSYPKILLKRCDSTEASRNWRNKRIKIEVVESHLLNLAPNEACLVSQVAENETLSMDDAHMEVANMSCVKEAPLEEEDEYDDNSDEFMVHDEAEEEKESSNSISSENSAESESLAVDYTEVKGEKDDVCGSLETNTRHPTRTIIVIKGKQEDKARITKNRITRPSKRKRIIIRDLRHHRGQQFSKSDDAASNKEQTKRDGIVLKQLAFDKVLQMRNDNSCNKLPCISKSFLTKADLINHLHHHGEFRCNFCDEVKSYSYELVAHEIKHHSKKHSGDKVETCPRCQVRKVRAGMEKHYMKLHLNLIPNRDTCPICRTVIISNLVKPKDFVLHYESHHYLSRTVDLDKVHLCQETDCRAYFQTYAQLHKHKESIHQLDLQNSKFTCQDCKKSFTEPRSLRKHRWKEHFTAERFHIKCTFDGCDNLFETQRDMKLHRRKHLMKTTPCSKEFLKDYSLMGHVKTSCNYSACTKVFYNEEDLKIHSQLHGKFKCQFCEVVVTYAPELATHEIDKHAKSGSSNLRECSRCQLSTTKDEVVAHFVEDHLQLKMDSHTCPICRFEFKSIKVVEMSIRRHFKAFHDLKYVDSSGKPYQCKEAGCSAYFLHNFQLIKHKNLHSISGKYKIIVSNKRRAIECLDCGKIFKSLSEIRSHRNKIHLDMRLYPLPCITDGCYLRFKTQDELDEHIAETEVVKCPDCNKTFHGIHGLQTHQRSHRNGPRKTWICETCGLKIRTEGEYKIHSLTHSGPDTWEFMCNVCSKKCLTKDSLNRHLRMHSKEKPSVCKVCGKKYADLRSLRSHVKANHKDFVMRAPKRTFKKTMVSSNKKRKVKLESKSCEEK